MNNKDEINKFTKLEQIKAEEKFDNTHEANDDAQNGVKDLNNKFKSDLFQAEEINVKGTWNKSEIPAEQLKHQYFGLHKSFAMIGVLVLGLSLLGIIFAGIGGMFINLTSIANIVAVVGLIIMIKANSTRYKLEYLGYEPKNNLPVALTTILFISLVLFGFTAIALVQGAEFNKLVQSNLSLFGARREGNLNGVYAIAIIFSLINGMLFASAGLIIAKRSKIQMTTKK
jgi:hypothetical protein